MRTSDLRNRDTHEEQKHRRRVGSEQYMNYLGILPSHHGRQYAIDVVQRHLDRTDGPSRSCFGSRKPPEMADVHALVARDALRRGDITEAYTALTTINDLLAEFMTVGKITAKSIVASLQGLESHSSSLGIRKLYDEVMAKASTR